MRGGKLSPVKPVHAEARAYGSSLLLNMARGIAPLHPQADSLPVASGDTNAASSYDAATDMTVAAAAIADKSTRGSKGGRAKFVAARVSDSEYAVLDHEAREAGDNIV